MASVNEGFEDASSPRNNPEQSAQPKQAKQITKTNPLEGLENARKRRFFRGTISILSNIGAFFEQRIKIRGAQHRFLRLLSQAPGLIQLGTDGVNFFTAEIATIPVRIYRPCESKSKKKSNNGNSGKYSLQMKTLPQQPGCIVYFHGAGFVLGSARAYHKILADLCLKTGSVVIAPECRLPPESPVLATLEDCCRVVRSILDDEPLNEILFDRNRVITMGDCSGGTLSICVAVDLIREPAKRRLHGVCAICPPLQAITVKQLESYNRNYPYSKLAYRPDWSLPRMAGILPVSEEIRNLINSDSHLPREQWLKLIVKVVPDQVVSEGSNLQPGEIPNQLTELTASPRFWPLLVDDEDLTQLPNMFLMACDRDPLNSEQKKLVDRLGLLIGDRIRFCLVNRALHCDPIFDRYVKSEASRQGYRQIVDFLKENFAKSPSSQPVFNVEERQPEPSVTVEIHQQTETAVDVLAVDMDDVLPRIMA